MTFDELCPKALSKIIPLKKICPDVISCRSQGNNPFIRSDRECCTITKTRYDKIFKLAANTFREPDINELKKIGSFPLPMVISGTKTDQWMRIGNSVPPGLMRAVAANVRHHLFDGPPLVPYPKSMSYLDILEATWQDHLKPKAENAPTVISTFAGGGGSSLGYSMAGFRELLAVEIDNNAVETFRMNFPHVPVFHGDIGKLSVEGCMELAGITEPGEFDVLDGSPPCQGFSTAGKRQMTDDRNQLFREYVRLLRGLQPKAFIVENVSGMVKGKMKIIFAEILRELKGSGYEVKAWLLNAKYFYVPQSRERMIFIGVRKDFWQDKSKPC